MFAITTKPGYAAKTSRQIGIGSTEDEVLEKYGQPLRKNVLAGRQGHYLAYAGAQIVCSIGPNNNVEGWMIYGLK